MAALTVGPSQNYYAYPLPQTTYSPQQDSQEAEEWRGEEEDEEEDEILYRRQGSSGSGEYRDPEPDRGCATRQEHRFCSTSHRRVAGPLGRMHGSTRDPQRAPCCSFHYPRSAGRHQESQNEEKNGAEESIEYPEKTVTDEPDRLEEGSDKRESVKEQYNGTTETGAATPQLPPATEQPQPPSSVNEGNALLRDEYVDQVWEEFVTDFLLGSCHIQKAAIFDLQTKRSLASNGNLHVRPEEFEQLVASLYNLRLAYKHGVTLSGKTYKVQLADGRNGILATTDGEGCTVCKTRTLVIIGWHDCRGNSRKCNEDVMRLGDFFRWKGV